MVINPLQTCPLCGNRQRVAPSASGPAVVHTCEACGEPFADSRVVQAISGGPRPDWARILVWSAGILVAALLLLISLFPLVSTPREASRRTICRNNLKQIGLALHNYHDDHGSFPPAYMADAKGKPMHGWRVLILPYLDQAPLYAQYRFDEPWDGPNNRQLAQQMPAIYRCPSHAGLGDGRSSLTSYCAVAGPGTAFEGSTATALGDIRDGAEQTILIVDVPGQPVHWMQPVDASLEQLVQLLAAEVELSHTGVIPVLFADGAAGILNRDVAPRTLRGLTTIAGDDPVEGF